MVFPNLPIQQSIAVGSFWFSRVFQMEISPTPLHTDKCTLQSRWCWMDAERTLHTNIHCCTKISFKQWLPVPKLWVLSLEWVSWKLGAGCQAFILIERRIPSGTVTELTLQNDHKWARMMMLPLVSMMFNDWFLPHKHSSSIHHLIPSSKQKNGGRQPGLQCTDMTPQMATSRQNGDILKWWNVVRSNQHLGYLSFLSDNEDSLCR